MTVFESKITLDQPIEKVYAFLSDLNNHEQLMPENIYNWSSTKDEAKFTIQNMAKLSLKVSARTQNEQIIILPTEDAPFAIEMKWTVLQSGTETLATLIVSAELNMMMKMLASKPLQKLVDHQTSALAKPSF
ncbi:orotate phosphoribosyltransferase [Pedobacter psychrophilus]|uniref:Orotate phosphoribosyltransferase n=1 Tax=Pedobacter psychrophilus TaxID=1826909 RepID=A0A179DB27_9SPHI|nr:SRPBCC family protein [Pedobacter psychrophilus]OAQ38124.1 orotate phosphoribosyltransferase [Pedobacter psychrophilus]